MYVYVLYVQTYAHRLTSVHLKYIIVWSVVVCTLQMGDIKRLTPRLECLSFRSRFDEEMEEMMPVSLSHYAILTPLLCLALYQY